MLLVGGVVRIYFVLILILLEHRTHARTANATWRGRVTWEKQYIITPYLVPGSTETLTAPTICHLLPARRQRQKLFGGWWRFSMICCTCLHFTLILIYIPGYTLLLRVLTIKYYIQYFLDIWYIYKYFFTRRPPCGAHTHAMLLYHQDFALKGMA